MAPEKKNINFNELLTVSPKFLNQLLFGLFLALILIVLEYPISTSIFLGVVVSFFISWITAASQTSPNAGSVSSSEGIDAGLKYWLFFLLAFVVLGYPAPVSILLGSLAGIGGGWLISWWKSKEVTRTQLPEEMTEDTQTQEIMTTTNTRRRFRKSSRRYRRSSGGINFPRFWQR